MRHGHATARALALSALVGAAVAGPAVAATQPVLRVGSQGPAVERLEQRLATLRFLRARAVDRVFDVETWHAVVAFQGWTGLARDGAVGRQTRRALARARRPVPWSRRRGFEAHLAEQVLLLVRHHRVHRAIHISSGAGGATPLGHFRITRRERMSWSVSFQVWMPFAQYFTSGYAMHAYPDVPAYPASHGCVRLPEREAVVAWRFGELGMRMWVSGQPQ